MAYQYQSILQDEMQSFIDMLSAAGRKVASYQVFLKSLDQFLINSCVSEKALPEELLVKWMDGFTCEASTKNRMITCCRVFGRYLMALEIQAFLPDYVKEQSDYIPYTFTDEEFRAIITAADEFQGNIRETTQTSFVFPMVLRLLYCCGLRVNEALKLTWENVDLTAGVLHIKNAKNDKDRDVPMDKSLTEMLCLFRSKTVKENPYRKYLFESDRKPGTPYLDWTFRRWFLVILERAGITNERDHKFDRGISPHTLRHYFTYKSFIQAENAGRSLEQFAPFLSAYLGHNSLLETERYLATDYTLYKNSQERVGRLISPLFPEVDFDE